MRNMKLNDVCPITLWITKSISLEPRQYSASPSFPCPYAHTCWINWSLLGATTCFCTTRERGRPASLRHLQSTALGPCVESGFEWAAEKLGVRSPIPRRSERGPHAARIGWRAESRTQITLFLFKKKLNIYQVIKLFNVYINKLYYKNFYYIIYIK